MSEKNSKEMLSEIAKLEAHHKRSGEESFKRELDFKASKLKLLQAFQTAKAIM